MRALILAAGMGTRLRPMTDSRPKAMVEVQDTPIIIKQLTGLINNDIKDISVVIGYKAEAVIELLESTYPFVRTIVNKDYNATNNMYSAYLAKHVLYGEPFLLLNADVFFDECVISELCKDEYKNAIVVEEGVYNYESMKVQCRDGVITEIGKDVREMDAFGVSTDVYKFSQESSRLLFDKITDYIEVKGEKNHWTEVAINDVLAQMDFNPCPLVGRWIEIDDHEDLRIAQKIFAV